jgi:hypothetical protein
MTRTGARSSRRIVGQAAPGGIRSCPRSCTKERTRRYSRATEQSTRWPIGSTWRGFMPVLMSFPDARAGGRIGVGLAADACSLCHVVRGRPACSALPQRRFSARHVRRRARVDGRVPVDVRPRHQRGSVYGPVFPGTCRQSQGGSDQSEGLNGIRWPRGVELASPPPLTEQSSGRHRLRR